MNQSAPGDAKPEDYCTTDLSLAAFLVARGYPLSRLLGRRGDRRVFCFPVDAEDSAPLFYRDSKVGARTYANALRDLKAMVRPL